MGLKALGAILIAAAVGFAAWPADPADAATSTKKQRTRVVVTKRSFLDAGTEVKPGDRHYHDYVFPPYHSGYTYDFTGAYRYPLPDPFWLPGYTGPYGTPGGGY